MDHRGVNVISQALPFWPVVVWRRERRNRLREVSQPITRRGDSRFCDAASL